MHVVVLKLLLGLVHSLLEELSHAVVPVSHQQASLMVDDLVVESEEQRLQQGVLGLEEEVEGKGPEQIWSSSAHCEVLNVTRVSKELENTESSQEAQSPSSGVEEVLIMWRDDFWAQESLCISNNFGMVH